MFFWPGRAAVALQEALVVSGIGWKEPYVPRHRTCCCCGSHAPRFSTAAVFLLGHLWVLGRLWWLLRSSNLPFGYFLNHHPIPGHVSYSKTHSFPFVCDPSWAIHLCPETLKVTRFWRNTRDRANKICTTNARLKSTFLPVGLTIWFFCYLALCGLQLTYSDSFFALSMEWHCHACGVPSGTPTFQSKFGWVFSLPIFFSN